MKKLRLPVEQIMAKAHDENGQSRGGCIGLVCPKCLCQQFRVRNTVPLDGSIRRYRVCRNCGHTWTTYEA